MPDGEWTSLQLEFGWGAGATHMAVHADNEVPVCSRCRGTRKVGDRLKVACPDCTGEASWLP